MEMAPEAQPAAKAESPIGPSEAAKLEEAEHILAQLRNNPQREWLEGSINSYMVRRYSRSEMRALSPRFESAGGYERYEANLRQVARSAVAKGVSASIGLDWTGFHAPNPTARPFERRQRRGERGAQSVEISYKDYFTVPVRVDDVEASLAQIKLFQDMLPNLVAELADLSKRAGDQIKLKVPGSLQSFLEHPDSIVVHHRDPALTTQVREIVERHLAATGLTSAREGRAESGFDIKSNQELYDGSHSSLISSLIAERAIRAVAMRPEMAYTEPKLFVRNFLDRAIMEESAKPPEEILRSLDQIAA